MDSGNRTRNNKYDRVMPRVHNHSRNSLNSSSFVTRHDKSSFVRVGAKPVASNVSSSGVFNELPTFLNDYVPESSREKVKRTYVVKPRKTIKSLDLAASPPRIKQRDLVKKSSNIRLQESAPSVLYSNGERWSATHFRECLSSRSHSRLKDLKDEIKAYKETEKLMRLRSSLFKKCGVVLDDVGNMAEDKAVQTHLVDGATDNTGQTSTRFRSPNEYAAPPESLLLPEDLPDDLYENLLDERPELEPILAPLRKTNLRRSKTSYTRKSTTVSDSGPISVYHKFEFPKVNSRNEPIDEDEDEYIMSSILQYTKQPERLRTNTTDSSAVARSSRMLPFLMRNLTLNDTRRWWMPNFFKEFMAELVPWPPWSFSPRVATCYTCGHDQPYLPPANPICHDLFDSQNWKARTLKRYFRSACYYNWKWRDRKPSRQDPYFWYGVRFENDRGLKVARMGDYLAGCFKRFLDIGTIYTARGCRKWWPDTSASFTGNRFMRLEYLLRYHKNKCITSPHASLTPFARGISLFARYHVCVCKGSYCNRATVSKVYNVLLLLCSIFIALFNIMNNLQ